jgi:hypothetical protein
LHLFCKDHLSWHQHWVGIWGWHFLSGTLGIYVILLFVGVCVECVCVCGEGSSCCQNWEGLGGTCSWWTSE